MSITDTQVAEDGEAFEGSGFKTFRFRDSVSLADAKAMDYGALTPAMLANLDVVYKAGSAEGAASRYLFGAPGFSLVHAWFKSGFPVTLHSHSAGCLYFITAGSLVLGSEEFGIGDGFFVPANVPYTYTAGPNGVEILEFRNNAKFDVMLRANGSAYWEKAASRIAEHRPAWQDEAMPSAIEARKSPIDRER